MRRWDSETSGTNGSRRWDSETSGTSGTRRLDSELVGLGDWTVSQWD